MLFFFSIADSSKKYPSQCFEAVATETDDVPPLWVIDVSTDLRQLLGQIWSYGVFALEPAARWL
jgi:hypothetical protein